MLDTTPTAHPPALRTSAKADILRVYETALDFNVSPILARYQREQSLPFDIVSDHHVELMRYLSMSAVGLSEKRYYGMLGAVDELWHTFVIFTRDYAAFCDKVAGQFLHHIPVVGNHPSDAKLDSYLLFLTDYEDVFSQTAPKVYWPVPGRVPNEATCGTGDDPGCSIGCSVACGCGTGPGPVAKSPCTRFTLAERNCHD